MVLHQFTLVHTGTCIVTPVTSPLLPLSQLFHKGCHLNNIFLIILSKEDHVSKDKVYVSGMRIKTGTDKIEL